MGMSASSVTSSTRRLPSASSTAPTMAWLITVTSQGGLRDQVLELPHVARVALDRLDEAVGHEQDHVAGGEGHLLLAVGLVGQHAQRGAGGAPDRDPSPKEPICLGTLVQKRSIGSVANRSTESDQAQLGKLSAKLPEDAVIPPRLVAGQRVTRTG